MDKRSSARRWRNEETQQDAPKAARRLALRRKRQVVFFSSVYQNAAGWYCLPSGSFYGLVRLATEKFSDERV